jgi:hypothetical protein
MAISRSALAELEQKTRALHQPGNRICAYTDSSSVSGWVMLGLVIDANFVAIAIPREDYRVGKLCKILGFDDPFDPNTTFQPPAVSAYARAVRQKLQPLLADPHPQAPQRSPPPQLPSPSAVTAAHHKTLSLATPASPEPDLEIADPDSAWPEEPSIRFEDSLTPLRGDEWDEPPHTLHTSPGHRLASPSNRPRPSVTP